MTPSSRKITQQVYTPLAANLSPLHTLLFSLSLNTHVGPRELGITVSASFKAWYLGYGGLVKIITFSSYGNARIYDNVYGDSYFGHS